MRDNFLTSKIEKRDNIINAAMLEFGENGYDAASTNEIVKAAGISKGALFHYFDSKKALFLFLIDYAFDITRHEYYERIDPCGGDLIGRYHSAAILKAELYDRHPGIFTFIKRLLREKSPAVAEEMAKKLSEAVKAGYDKLTEGIDVSLFRTDIPIDKAQELIVWAIEGYGNSKAGQYRNDDYAEIDKVDINKEFDEYLAILKKCFYKES